RAVIIYRRSEEEMPAYHFEQEMAKKDGCEFMFHLAPIEVVAENGHVAGLKLARTASTNGSLQILKGTEFIERFDMVIKAIGEQKQVSLLNKLFPNLELDKRGAIVYDRDTG